MPDLLDAFLMRLHAQPVLLTVTVLLVHIQPGTSTAPASFQQNAMKPVSSQLALSQVQQGSALALTEHGKAPAGPGFSFAIAPWTLLGVSYSSENSIFCKLIILGVHAASSPKLLLMVLKNMGPAADTQSASSPKAK